MKIVFLGDSLTWGGYGGNFVAKVAESLPDHEIINAGVGGNTVINLLRRLDTILDLEPDAIFVMVGGNDAISYLYPDTRSYYRKSQGLENGFVSPEEFVETYRELLTQIRLQHIVTWVGLAPTEYNTEVLEMKNKYNELAREIAESFNIPVLDLGEHFVPEQIQDRPPINLKFIFEIGDRSSSGWNDYATEQQRLGYSYTFDGMHLMPEAADKMASIIVDFLLDYL